MAAPQSDPPSADAGRVPGIVYVWAAVLLFAAANSVVQLLADLGARHPVEGRNAISFCNLLFVGNLCACATLLVVYRRAWTTANLKALSGSDWLSLVVLGILSGALAPALIFFAIEKTTVTNVVLVGRIEPFLLLILSMVFLREAPRPWIAAGTVVALLGIGLALYLQTEKTMTDLGNGELQAALGAAVLAISTVLSKSRLQRIPLGIFTVVRTGLGAVIFFAVAAYLFGPVHFMDAFNPFLWKWMLVYGALVIVAGQFFWFTGIMKSGSAEVSLATSFSPIAGIAFAFLLLGERPDAPVLIAAAVIVAGIIVAQVGERRSRRKRAALSSTEGAVAAEGSVSFKGI